MSTVFKIVDGGDGCRVSPVRYQYAREHYTHIAWHTNVNEDLRPNGHNGVQINSSLCFRFISEQRSMQYHDFDLRLLRKRDLFLLHNKYCGLPRNFYLVRLICVINHYHHGFVHCCVCGVGNFRIKIGNESRSDRHNRYADVFCML